MRLTVGDVIRWDPFPYPREGTVKARWFICLGRSSIVSTPVFAHLCTTTTQLHQFEAGGSRANHNIRRFGSKQYKMFDADCALDFEEEPYPITEDVLRKCENDITLRGRLDIDTMRNIYNQFLKSDVISKMIMFEIHESFGRDGITGLKRPR